MTDTTTVEADTWAVVSPDGELTWYPFADTTTVERIVGGYFGPTVTDAFFVAPPLRAHVSDVALLEPTHFAANPTAAAMVTRLSRGRLAYQLAGYMALTEYERTDDGEWLGPGPLSAAWHQAITDAWLETRP